MNNFRNYYIKYLYELFLTSKVNMQMFRWINNLFVFLATSLHHFGSSISDRGAKFCIIMGTAFTAAVPKFQKGLAALFLVMAFWMMLSRIPI